MLTPLLSKNCFRKVSNIHFIEMQNADHMFLLTHSEDLYQEIISFMEV
ncbi:hypothetical protein [Oceanobacillus arenosus]|nr:hypothetical protein [Oceanobacillus arenosus]